MLLTTGGQNHHRHDILLSIPIGMIVGFLGYRTQYASVFDYRKNHLPLPWSGSNESLDPKLPKPIASNQKEARHQILREKGNLAATNWPRKSKTLTYGQGRRVEPELDGAIDQPSPAMPAAGSTLRRRLGFRGPRRARARLAIFPRQPGVDAMGLNTDGVAESRASMDEGIGRAVSGRVGVDSWADANRGSRTGRASEMV